MVEKPLASAFRAMRVKVSWLGGSSADSCQRRAVSPSQDRYQASSMEIAPPSSNKVQSAPNWGVRPGQINARPAANIPRFLERRPRIQ